MYFFLQILNPDRHYDPKSHMVAGGIAGGLAAALTTPLDCIKTVLNTQQTATVEKDGAKNLILQVFFLSYTILFLIPRNYCRIKYVWKFVNVFIEMKNSFFSGNFTISRFLRRSCNHSFESRIWWILLWAAGQSPIPGNFC